MKKNLYLLSAVTLLLSACSSPKSELSVPQTDEERRQYGFGSILGEGALDFGNSRRKDDTDYSKLTVNPYLWQATLSTFADVPLVSCDSLGGTIITDWYTPKNTSDNEMLKVSVYLSGKYLKANAVKVKIHKKIKRSGHWQQVAADHDYNIKIEDLILSEARRIKIRSRKS